MSVTKDEAELRRRAQERCSSGQLPRSTQGRAWAGRGGGRVCALCDQTIEVDEIEYELDAPSGTAIQVIRFHAGCYRLWRECSHT
jgi:hypothetical protein